METDAHIRSVFKQQSPNVSIVDNLVTELLGELESDESVLWCAGYVNMEKKFGALSMLTVTDRRIIDQEAGRSSKLAEIPLDRVHTAIDDPHKVLFGLTTNHYLEVHTDAGTIVWKDLPDSSVAAGANSIQSAKAGAPA